MTAAQRDPDDDVLSDIVYDELNRVAWRLLPLEFDGETREVVKGFRLGIRTFVQTFTGRPVTETAPEPRDDGPP